VVVGWACVGVDVMVMTRRYTYSLRGVGSPSVHTTRTHPFIPRRRNECLTDPTDERGLRLGVGRLFSVFKERPKPGKSYPQHPACWFMWVWVTSNERGTETFGLGRWMDKTAGANRPHRQALALTPEAFSPSA
jgi:hypothetical protein